MAWLAKRKRTRHSVPSSAGKIRPGWVSSAPMPASAPSRSRNSRSGRAMTESTRCRQFMATVRVVSFLRCSVTAFPSKRLISLPSSARRSAGTSGAMRSMSLPSRASRSVNDLLSSTAFSARSTLRPRCCALPRT